MAAKKGNKYAEKWTEKTVLAKIAEIENVAKSSKCKWLGNALLKTGLHKDVWADWRKKFAGNKEVSRAIKRVDLIFEDKLVTSLLDESGNKTGQIFALKNNYGWKDKSEVDHTTGGDKIEGFTFNVKTNDS